MFENACLDVQWSNKSRKQLPQTSGEGQPFGMRTGSLLAGGIWDTGDVLCFSVSGGYICI